MATLKTKKPAAVTPTTPVAEKPVATKPAAVKPVAEPKTKPTSVEKTEKAPKEKGVGRGPVRPEDAPTKPTPLEWATARLSLAKARLALQELDSREHYKSPAAAEKLANRQTDLGEAQETFDTETQAVADAKAAAKAALEAARAEKAASRSK